MDEILINAEIGIASALVTFPHTVVPTVRSKLTEDDFITEPGRAIFKAVCTLTDAGTTIDPVVVKYECEKQGVQISNPYMLDVMSISTDANTEKYCDLLREEGLRRRLLEVTKQAVEDLTFRAIPTEVCSRLQREIDAALEREKSSGLVGSDEALLDFIDYRTSLEQGKFNAFVDTGYQTLDNVLGGGFVSEGFYILAARPGTGKTTLALEIADRVAGRGVPTLFVSLEMSINQLTAKRLAVRTGLSSNDILLGQPSEKEQETLADASQALAQCPLTFNRKPGASVSDIGFLASQVKGCGFVIIDYLGLIQHEPGKSLYERVTQTSGALKQLARTLGIPILCLAQLNRDLNGGKPKISNLRDSGAIEQDADGVLLLHSPAPDEKREPSTPVPLECIVAKNRHGATGRVDFNFYPTNGRIRPVRGW